MASYFPLPSAVVKRLIRYAIQQSGFLDTDSLDLEQLDIGWGKRSSIELKDVKLRKAKLDSLLHLPEQLSIAQASVLTVKITVPADIHTSSIVITVQGVRVNLELCKPSPVPSEPQSHHAEASSHKKRKSSCRARSPGYTLYHDTDDEDALLPSVHNLAKSFLAEEPLAEKKELEAAFASRSPDLRQSVASLASTESESEEGHGTGIGLPGFLAAFVRGMIDRLQITIDDVRFKVDITSLDLKNNHPRPPFALGLEVASITSSHGGYSVPVAKSGTEAFRSGKRNVRLSHLRCSLLYDDVIMPSADLHGTDMPDTSDTPTASTLFGNTTSTYSIREAIQACRDDRSARRSPSPSQMHHSLSSSGLRTPRMARSLSKIHSPEQQSSSSPSSHDQDEHLDGDDLTQSTVFSQSDAESMYMSAIDSSSPLASFKGQMPGGWADEISGSGSVPHGARSDTMRPPRDTPMTTTGQDPDHSLASSLQAILECNRIDLWLPESPNDEADSVVSAMSPQLQPGLRQTRHPQTSTNGPPGSFSSYAEKRLKTSSAPAAAASQATEPNKTKTGFKRHPVELLDVEVSPITLGLDSVALRLLVALFRHVSDTQQSDSPSDTLPIDTQGFPFMRAIVQALNMTLVDQLQEQPWKPQCTAVSDISGARALLTLDLQHLETFANADQVELNISTVILKAAGKPLITFDDQARLRTSIRDLKEQSEKDFRMIVKNSSAGRDIDVKTKTVKINIDIKGLEESVESSGILKVLLAEATNSDLNLVQTQPRRRPRVVRFESKELKPKDRQHTVSTKLNVRLSGSSILVRGSNHSMRCHTSALKVVSRDQVFAIKIDEVRTKGPYVNGLEDSMATLRIRNLDVRFLPRPEEADLSRLISLLTPSHNRFEDDDDLLVDTLIRQRRKGAVLRINLLSVELDVLNKARVVDGIRSFASDLACVSAVAQYLPEDDRPGLMTLIKINETIVNLETDQAIGILSLTLGNSDFAHVNLPSFFACSLGKLQLERDDQTPIVTQLIEGNEATPMLMARMIGDEPEQAVKVKLWNTSFEYNIPLVMAALGLPEIGSVDTLVADVAASILSLTTSQCQDHPGNASSEHAETGPLHIQVALRDCAIGLRPGSLPSKMLLILSDAIVCGSSITDNALSGQLYLKKGGVLIVDDIRNLLPTGTETMTIPQDGKLDHLSHLCKAGYVSVSSISAAVLDLKFRRGVERAADMLEIGFKDELLVLETCADSTQTLLDTLNDLMPPLPPQQGIRYRTEIAPMEDMLASFSGEDFALRAQSDAGSPPNGKFGEESADSELELDFEDLGDILDTPHARNAIPSVPNGRRGKKTRFGSVPHRLEEINGPLQPAPNKPERRSSAKKWDSVNNRYVPVSSAELASVPLRVKVRDVHFIWNLFDGYDWQKTRDTITKAVHDVEQRAEERRRRPVIEDEREKEPVIGDFLFNSIYIGIPATADPQELTRQINRNMDDLVSETASMASTAASRPSSSHRPHKPHRKLKLQRSRRHKLAIELRGLSADIFMYAPGGETQSSVDVRLTDLEIFDHVTTSTWKKFATYMHDSGPRLEGQPMIHLEICNVRPIPELLASELVIRATVLPMRLHIDQDALDFMTRFFEFSDDTRPAQDLAVEEPYLQRVEVLSVPVKMDYKPKKIDFAGLRSGRTTEFMNFFILEDAEFVLKHTIVYGTSGFTKLRQSLEDVWMPDIKHNQLPGVLSGLNGVRTVVNVGSGMRDLVMIPIQEYRKDGRVVRSITKGAAAFAKTTGGELTKFGARLAIGAQNALQGAEVYLAGGSIDNSLDEVEGDADEKRAISHYADQPAGILQGLKGAARSLERDILVTKDAIIAISGEMRDNRTAEGAARAVVRHAPTLVLRPMIGASKAISQTLMGATNTVDPQNRRRVEEKYKKY